MFKQALVLVFAAALLGACASIVEGTDQSIAVSSHPSGAFCILEREGGQIGAVNPTPGTVRIEKSTEDITVLCSKPGYQDSIGVLVSEFEGMTAGNLIFGGVVGLAVDAGSGAMYYYPPSIIVELPPE